MFYGHPIIYYSIKAAQDSGLFARIVVSTDDDWIGRYSEGCGATWYTRSTELTGEDIGTQEVTADVIRSYRAADDPYDYACCIYPCAPMMIAEDLRIGFRALTDPRAQTDFAYSVGMNPFRDAGNWYWGKTQSFLDGVPLDPDGFNIMKVVIPNERVCDINTPEDWSRAEAMYAALHPEVA